MPRHRWLLGRCVCNHSNFHTQAASAGSARRWDSHVPSPRQLGYTPPPGALPRTQSQHECPEARALAPPQKRLEVYQSGGLPIDIIYHTIPRDNRKLHEQGPSVI
ncbi:hypothetical protein NDU88_006611 [Pleurodeles waltl]|uniref:Uncharacterized protein n=1 Tax=Pleurodeles waltl TaxID=8319 RepID=A0AAV7MED8_PLEWA|nr:hypothetical protein NDU88_006611 [Pleurodeles waltl]